MGTKGIDQNTIWDRFYMNMFQDDHTCSYIYPNSIKFNNIVLILKGARGNVETGHHTIFTYQNMGWSINKNSDNSDLVAH